MSNEIPVISSDNVSPKPGQFRSDSRYLMNVFSSVNNVNFDPQAIDINTRFEKLVKSELSSLVRKNGVLNRAVYDYPKTASSSWVKLNFGKETKENPDDVLTYLRNIPWYVTSKPSITDYGVRSAFKYASGLARKFGSAHIVLGVSDGQDISEPIDTNRIQSIDFMKVYDCWELPYVGAFGTTNYSGSLDPKSVVTNDHFLYFGVRIHPSRVLTFYGNRLDTVEEIVGSQYQHDSIIMNMFECFNNWLDGNKATLQLLLSSSVFGLGIDDLGERIRADIEQDSTVNQQALTLRATSFKSGLNVSKLALFDKTMEELITVNRSLAGTKDALESLKDAFGACSDMPRHRLFNEINAGGGMASSVGSTQILDFNWAKCVSGWAYDNWLQPLDMIIKLGMQTRDLYGTVLTAYTENSIDFPISMKLSETDQMALEKLSAEKNKILFDMEALTKEEIRQQYLSARFNSGIVLDS